MCVLRAVTAWGLWIMGIQGIPEDDQDCRSTIEGFKDGVRKPAEQARIEAIRILSKHKCSRSVAALAPLLTADTDSVRTAAANALGTMQDPKAVDAVATAVLSNSQRHEVLEALAKALESLDWDVGATPLNPLLAKHHDKDVLETLHVVVPVLGKLGNLASVEPLIKLLEHAETEGQRTRALGRRIPGNAQMAALEPLIKKALQEITGGKESTAKLWEEWWKANQENVLGTADLVYRCKESGRRWSQKKGKPIECPFHTPPGKDGQRVRLRVQG